MMNLIDDALLDAVSAEALASPRRRKNRNFHDSDDHPAHRLLNAMEPDSYIAPHRHADPLKAETMIVLRGRLGLIEFDAGGHVLRIVVLGENCDAKGVDILHDTWHTVVALEPGTVFIEAKAGPYRPHRMEERAAWAPLEGDAGAPAYLQELAALFAAKR